MARHSFGAIAAAAVTFAALSGCGSGGEDDLVEVSGTVKLDGVPLEKGLIRLEPVDGKGPSAAAPIANGEYTAKVTPGDKKVSVSAKKPVEGPAGNTKAGGAHGSAPTKEMIPAQYNTQSKLTLKVGPGGQDDAHFDLKSTP